MKAVIPAAGVGKRLRPHTLNKPKALLPVAGKPILGHIVGDLLAAGVDHLVIVVGYMQQGVRDWFTAEWPSVSVTFVEQEQRLGLGHAIWQAREALGDEPFFCILGDTILKANYGKFLAEDHSVIAVREVEDPRRFGVVELEGDRVSRLVEKPDHPQSRLAIVGAYLFREVPALWGALDRVISNNITTKGEYQLTDALQLMVANGASFRTVPVAEWFDCGKPETWLQTNRILLDRGDNRPGPTGVTPPCAIAPGVDLSNAKIGPYVSIGAGSTIVDCDLEDCVIGAHSKLYGCQLSGSLVGDHCQVTSVCGAINVGDYSEVRFRAG
jgi:glucose-1-phosphate thymidylyltransferase